MNSTGIRFGIIGGLLSILFSLTMHFTGLYLNRGVGSFGYLLVIGIVVMSIHFFKQNECNGRMTFKEGFWNAMRTSLIMSLIASLWLFVYVKAINPNFLAEINNLQYEELVKQKMPEEQIEVAMEMAKKFTTLPVLFVSGLIMYIMVGTITGAITSAIMKNKTNDE